MTTKYLEMRVLVTGWRYWPRSHEGFVHGKLNDIRAEYPELVVVQGKCPKGGVDLYAEEWAESTDGVRNEPHPANWARFGSAAGSIRNGEMVALGAHICLAFPQDRWGPSGTVNCYNQARTAGILTIVYPWDEVQ